MPTWWGRPHALPVKAASWSSEALSSDTWSFCPVCVSWVMVTGMCIWRSIWVPAVGLPTSVYELGALGQGCSPNSLPREDPAALSKWWDLFCQVEGIGRQRISYARSSETTLNSHSYRQMLSSHTCTLSLTNTHPITLSSSLQSCHCHVGPYP